MIECSERPACAGCDLFETTFDQWRAEVEVSLKSIGANFPFKTLPQTWVPAPTRERYRPRARMVVNDTDNEEKLLGFYKPGTRTVVPISHCLVHAPPIETAFSAVRKFLARNPNVRRLTRFVDARFAGPNVVVTFCTREAVPNEAFIDETLSDVSVYLNVSAADGAIMSGESTLVSGDASALEWRVGAEMFSAAPDAFFQTNPDVLEQIHTHLRTSIETSFDVLYDLYCGVGVHGLSLAGGAPIVGFDHSTSSIEHAAKNSNARGRENDQWIASSDVGFEIAFQPNALVVLNPARAGAHRSLISQVVSHRDQIASIAYVSCEPKTLYRDLGRLSLDFEVTSVTAFEMMPHTSHVELVAILKRREAPIVVSDASLDKNARVARLVGKAPNGPLPGGQGHVKKLRRLDGATVVRIDSEMDDVALMKACRQWGYPVLGDSDHGYRSANFAAARDHYLDRPVLARPANGVEPFLLQFLELPAKFFLAGGGFWKQKQ